VGEIEIIAAGSHEFGVEVTDGSETTSHRVIVPPSMLDDLGLDEGDGADVVRTSFEFLMEREPASAILPEFSLAIISRYYPEYRDELPGRLANPG
jgi:bifunctional DNA-binding transcriptional regulator/antitoxin component of YhaV-PrlF toxin-antitoxin module